MTVSRNRLWRRLDAGETARGLFSFVSSPALIELFAINGLDFVIVDHEHGPPSFRLAEDIVRAADVFELATIMRLPYQDFDLVARYLDSGAQGILAPHISTAAQAQAFVDSVKFAPIGKRSVDGVLLSRAARTMPSGSTRDRMDWANSNVMTIALIEDIAAVDNLDQILAIEGLDTILVGPTDLSGSMGHFGDWHHPDVHQAVDHIQDAAIKAGKILLVPMATPSPTEAIAAATARGARMIASSDYTIVEAGIADFLRE